VADFKWASNRYQEKLSLSDISGKLYQDVMKVDEELRAKQVEYNTVKSGLQAQERRQKGSLAVRSLSSLGLKAGDFVDTENLVTVVVVVPKGDEKTWLSSYATQFLDRQPNLGFYPVLLNSTKKVYDKDDTDDLWTVTVFRRMLGDFKQAVREKQPKWSVRDFSFDAQAVADEKSAKEHMELQESRTRKNLISWCKAQYGEVFRAFLHLKVIRLFVESALRFGVPPDFQAVVMRPNMKYEKSLREALLRQFSHLGNKALYAGGDDAAGGFGGQEFYPYVFLSLAVTQSIQKQ
jgi:V-type H+-transporting ATPase subunit C